MRYLPAVFFAAILVCVSAVKDVTRLVEKYKDANEARREWFKRLHPNGAPDFSQLKKSMADTPVSYNSGYSSAGFVASSYFLDDQCTDAVLTFGFPVNTCYIEVGYAYMVRLTKDSCAGGVVQYFYDKQCTDYAGSSDLTESPSMSPCSGGGGFYTGTVCTTSSQPKVYSESVMIRNYRGNSCGATDSYVAFPTNQCSETDDGSEDVMFTCNGGLQQVSYVAGSNCGLRTSTMSIPSMCFETTSSGDDDDGFDDDDESHERLPAPTVRGRVPAAATAAAAKLKALVGAQAKTAPRAAAKTYNPSLRAADTNKQALALVPTDDDVNYYDDGSADDDRVYYYDDGTYSSGYGYGDDDSIGGDFLNPPPSVSTTPFPTTTSEANAASSLKYMCQAAPQTSTVVFTAKQTIDGVSFSDYSDNKAAYEKTFKQAIASAISGATENSVTNLVVTAGTATASVTIAMSHAPAQFIKRMLSSSNSLALSYTVTVKQTTLTVDELMGQLVTAVETGSFTNAMQSYAAENGADGLETATSDSVTTESQEDDSGKKTLSDGAIIGIAVGVGVPVIAAFIFAVVYCCSSCGRNTTATTTAAGVPAAPAASAPPQEVELVPHAAAAETSYVGHNPYSAVQVQVQAQPYNPKMDVRPAVEVSAV